MSEQGVSNMFRHSPINPVASEIRLLQIDPDIDGTCCPRCSISTTSLDYSLPYLALSYTWGDDASPRHRISLSGKDYHVMRNPYDFLVSFRNDAANKEETFIWIDQMCINQEDKTERSASIRLMRRIYRQATYVIQWLGCEPDLVEAATYLSKISKQTLPLDPSVGTVLESKHTEHLCVLLNNRYFTRLWIVQEMFLAKTVQILCKHVWLSPNELRDRLHEPCLRKDKEYGQPLSLAAGLVMLDGWSTHRNRRHTLQHYIILCSAQDCADPRDKVYALLGLVGEEEQVDVDYDKSVLAVFLDIVRVFARSYLGCRGGESQEKNFGLHFITVARKLAKDMGLVGERQQVGDTPSQPAGTEVLINKHEAAEEQAERALKDEQYEPPCLLWHFLDELRTKEPDDHWFQRVLREEYSLASPYERQEV
jgi:hypothetical protein